MSKIGTSLISNVSLLGSTRRLISFIHDIEM